MAKTIINPVNLLQTQEGAVVSKEIVRKPNGSITIFAFDKNEGLSEHTSPFEAVAHIVEGVVDITIAGEKFQLNAGELIVMPANIPHALHAVEAFKMILTILR